MAKYLENIQLQNICHPVVGSHLFSVLKIVYDMGSIWSFCWYFLRKEGTKFVSKSDVIHCKTQFWTEESTLKQTSADLIVSSPQICGDYWRSEVTYGNRAPIDFHGWGKAEGQCVMVRPSEAWLQPTSSAVQFSFPPWFGIFLNPFSLIIISFPVLNPYQVSQETIMLNQSSWCQGVTYCVSF